MLGQLSVDRLHPGRHCPEANEVPSARYRRAATRGVITVCAALPLLAAAPVMADETVGGTAGGARTASGPHSDQGIDTLLLKLEQQIAAGHTLIPESDNAMETWRDVTAKMQSASPEALRTLASFAAHLRDRAASEQQEGRLVTATYFGVFAGMASDLVGAAGAPTVRRAETSAPVAAAADKVSPAPADSNAGPAATGAGSDQSPTAISGLPGPRISAPAEAPGTNATHQPASTSLASTAQEVPAVTPPQPPAAAASVASSPAPRMGAVAEHPPAPEAPQPASVAAPPPLPASAGTPHQRAADAANASPTGAPSTQAALALAPPPATSASPAPPAPARDQAVVAALYAARGDQMLAIKDISAARRFYEYAANAGSARAAMQLAKTFDPGFLDELGVVGLRPDPTLATAWYRKAMELGDHDAEASLRRLSMDAAK